MPKIKGLDEQKKALSDIKKLIKKVKGINSFLDNLENVDGSFSISYNADVYEDSVPQDTLTFSDEVLNKAEEMIDLNNENNNHESVIIDASSNELFKTEANESEDALAIKKKKSKKFEASFETNNIEFIRECIIDSKKSCVDEINKLTDEFNIYLEEEDRAIMKL